jgi:4a-hydroxytetrahydrobiopterin dehydratase
VSPNTHGADSGPDPAESPPLSGGVGALYFPSAGSVSEAGSTFRAMKRAEISRAVEATGWRLVMGRLCASVPVTSLRQGNEVAARAIDSCGRAADEHLRIDVRADRVELSLAAEDVELATTLTGGLGTDALAPPTGTGRPVQVLEIAIDALDIPTVMPFWKAVLAYEQVGGDELVDPAHQGPALWFQQLDEPREQRNRIHFDIAVAHDEADRRLAAALAAGGTLLTDAHARAFWVLADPEGNEICICTWEDRD